MGDEQGTPDRAVERRATFNRMTGAGEGLAMSDNDVMMALTVLQGRMLPGPFIRLLVRYHRILFTTLARFGWLQSPKDDMGYVRAFEDAQRRWMASAARAAPADEIVLAALPNGIGFIGRRSQYEAAVERFQHERAMRTLENVRSGPAGTLGYFLGGDAGSDVGALLDSLAGAAGRTAQARESFKALSTPVPYRPAAAQIAPAGGSRATSGPATNAPGTGGAPAPRAPEPPPPSPPAATPQTPSAAGAAPSGPTAPGGSKSTAGGATANAPAGGAKPSSRAGRGGPSPSPPAGGGPPKDDPVTRTIAKLAERKIDVNDSYTMQKLREIYGNYQKPDAFLKAARAGIGEMRAIVRASKAPGVKLVRFLRPAQGRVTPDIEVEMHDGRRSYVEVRTLTQAPNWTQMKHDARRAELKVLTTDIEQKIRHGQISSSRPGTLVIHAPFQKITAVSLEGWREMLQTIVKRAPLPDGLRSIEVSTGTGGAVLVFQPPDWRGVIVQ